MTQRSVHAVLFDKDGTLIEFDATWGSFCARVIRRIAPADPATQRELAHACGYDFDRNGFIAGSTIVNGTPQDTFAAWQSVMPGLDENTVEQIANAELVDLPVQPIDGLVDMLHQLQSTGHQLGVATNDHEHSARTQLAHLQITDHFDFIAGHDSGFGAKPDAGMIIGFCRAVGVMPQNVAMVGDSTHDIDAAHAAGCYAIGVASGPADAADLISADVVLDSIADLPKFLAGQR